MVLQHHTGIHISHFACMFSSILYYIHDDSSIDKMIIKIITREFVDTEIVWVINK